MHPRGMQVERSKRQTHIFRAAAAHLDAARRTARPQQCGQHVRLAAAPAGWCGCAAGSSGGSLVRGVLFYQVQRVPVCNACAGQGLAVLQHAAAAAWQWAESGAW